MAVARASAAVLLFALVAATASTAGSFADATSPRLTRNVPGIVQLMCLFVEKDAPIKIVHGTVMGYGDAHLKAPRNRLYLSGFNAGDTGADVLALDRGDGDAGSDPVLGSVGRP